MTARFIYAAVAAVFIIYAPPAFAHSMTSNTVWSGTVKVEGQLVVEKGVTLTVKPGAKVLFVPGKLDEKGLSDSGMLVKGTFIADGKPGARIAFTSGSDRPAPGDWGEIKLFESHGSSIRDCDFSYGGWGLHLHDSDLTVSGCTFTDNSFGGVRMKGGQVEVAGCRMEGLDIGIRYWKGSPSIHHNTITKNKTGIFCRQEAEGSTIKFNNIFGNSEYDMKLGDGQKEDLDATRNWWGTTEMKYIRKKIFDHDRDDYIGRVLVEPALSKKVELPQPLP